MNLNLISKRVFVILIIVLIGGCKKDDGGISLNNEVNEFIRRGMQTYYFWQSDVPDLADDRFQTFDEVNQFLNQFPEPETLFDHFMHADDRFSFIVNDYEVLDNALQGVSNSFGYEFQIVRIGSTSGVFGVVEYVLPNSPANNAGLQRGDLFHSINGTALTESNVNELVSGVSEQVLSLGDFVSRDVGLNDNGRTVSMVSATLQENPVFLAETIDIGGVKVGYLVYNQFINTFHRELNAAFGEFKANGVTEMILDLRYNSGGSVLTARILASMLYDEATDETILGTIMYNQKLSDLNSDLTFLETVPLDDGTEEAMNRLNINRLFILTGSGTASASELIINGLQPYMDLTLIGSQTVGKNVGSVTLYDAPGDGFLSKNGINANHRYAMQPIISQIANSVGFTDFVDGIAPAIEIDELDYIGDLKPLGDETEPLLAEALGIISGTGRKGIKPAQGLDLLYNSRNNRPFSYIILDSEQIKQ